MTETLFKIGAESEIVGITKFCPNEGKNIETIGGVKDPNLKKILAIKPDMIIVSSEENRQEDLRRLENEIEIFDFSPSTVTESAELLKKLGEVLDHSEEANEISKKIFTALNKNKKRLQEDEKRSKKERNVACFVWQKPIISFNGKTYASDLIKKCGVENIFAKKEKKYFKTTIQEVEEREPDMILLPSEPFEFDEEYKNFYKNRFNKGIEIKLVDGQMLFWYGYRTSLALPYLIKILSTNLLGS